MQSSLGECERVHIEYLFRFECHGDFEVAFLPSETYINLLVFGT